MRIKWLELKAFGPFSGRILDFSSELPGLHVVYGPNEAGKSSSLRALQALFFGFPARSGDNFLHPYDQLLVGGCLQGNDGSNLTFYRRKRNKNSLFDQHGNPLDGALLIPFLHGLEADLFTTLYGIDHETLVRGGQGILDQQGEVGQALFAAGSGLASLKGILDDLEREGDELFRPRGSSQSISMALNEYKEIQENIKQVTLSSREWQEHRRTLDEAEEKQEQLNALRTRLGREKNQLERLKRALPYLGERRILVEKLAEMGAVLPLPLDFAERRKNLEQRHRETRLRLETANRRLHDLREKTAEIALNRELLDRAEAIEELHQRLGQYKKGNSDRPVLDGRRIGLRTEAANLLKQIQPGLSIDEIEPLRPSLAKKKTIQNLAGRYEALVQGLRQADRAVRTTAQTLEDCRKELGELSPEIDIVQLSQAIVRAQKAGDLDGEIASRRKAWDQTRQICQNALERLGLWNGPLDLVVRLPVPLPETVNRHEEVFRTRDAERQRLGDEREKLEDELTKLLTQLRQIEYAAEIPTEEELAHHRNRRDRGWQLLRRQWLQGEDVAAECRDYDSDHPLPEAYEIRVDIADRTADRLYREADRVQKHASLKTRAEEIQKRLSTLQELAEKTEAGWAEAARNWRELWSPAGIHPLSPREMRSWLNGFDKLRFQLEEAGKIAASQENLESSRRQLRLLLTAELAAVGQGRDFPGEELSPLLQCAEALAQRVQREKSRREALENRIRELARTLETAEKGQNDSEEALDQWRSQWVLTVKPLGIAETTVPSEVQEYIDALQGCFDKLREADDFRKRMEGIDRDAGDFEEAVQAVALGTAADLATLETSQIVAQLKTRLARAGQDQALVRGYGQEIEDQEKMIIGAQTELASIDQQMADLYSLAGCETAEQLDEAERHSMEHLKCREKLQETERLLARIAEGISLGELEEQARGVDPDELPGKIEGLNREIEGRIDPDSRRLSETIGREKNELARMDGSGRAAELADAAQQALARIRRLTERYMRLKLATKILREEIECYRAENQDPILAIASRYFTELTLGSFAGLRTDIDDQGQPVLIGVRPEGKWVPVAGMSSGTCDQLYLALRLATLEWRLRADEPMPFIVDDILINFDDQRSEATLRALSKLAEKTQVILFTHHRQIPETAASLNRDGKIFIHDLAP
ncbi:MAG: AAA family ATPase [Desulfuromonadaceae bacterium]|nr:AAA family ATPase [Desulfuromonadaceae bacterium]